MESIIGILADTNESLHKRIRALFSLKPLGEQAIPHLIKVLVTETNILLSHEIAYVLGQMNSKLSLPTLTVLLENPQTDPIIRHECAESMGAIGCPSSLPILTSLSSHTNKLISETCIISIARIQEKDDPENFVKSRYTSIDPAPAEKLDLSCDDLEEIMLDTKIHLYTRYKAMFALRNLHSSHSVRALSRGFTDPSPLFRHEIAFVFGQMQHLESVPALIRVLEDLEEVGVVRHEAAEALGSIATPECFQVLKRFLNDDVDVVRDSCVVGLDMAEHEKNQELDYAYVLNR